MKGDITFLISALVGLGVALVMLGFGLADPGSPAGLDEVQVPKPEREKVAAVYQKAA
jgi:hypothetical protein